MGLTRKSTGYAILCLVAAWVGGWAADAIPTTRERQFETVAKDLGARSSVDQGSISGAASIRTEPYSEIEIVEKVHFGLGTLEEVTWLRDACARPRNGRPGCSLWHQNWRRDLLERCKTADGDGYQWCDKPPWSKFKRVIRELCQHQAKQEDDVDECIQRNLASAGIR